MAAILGTVILEMRSEMEATRCVPLARVRLHVCRLGVALGSEPASLAVSCIRTASLPRQPCLFAFSHLLPHPLHGCSPFTTATVIRTSPPHLIVLISFPFFSLL